MPHAPHSTRLERRLGDWARAAPFGLAELVMFVLKQGWACLFGGLLLIAILATRAIWRLTAPCIAMTRCSCLPLPRRPSFCGKGWRHGRKPASS